MCPVILAHKLSVYVVKSCDIVVVSYDLAVRILYLGDYPIDIRGVVGLRYKKFRVERRVVVVADPFDRLTAFVLIYNGLFDPSVKFGKLSVFLVL